MGYATASAGDVYGVYGRSDSTDGYGVFGDSRASSGFAYGVYGKSDSSRGRGVFGYATNDSGNTFGMYGRADSPDGTGVVGSARSESGQPVGVKGVTESGDSGTAGVAGVANASSGTTYGVKGSSNSSAGYGLYTPDDTKIDGTVEVGGDLKVAGTKNFVQTISTEDGPDKIAYTAVEAGQVRTETSDVAKMTDKTAVVELPDHFSKVTNEKKPLIVQVTPYTAKEAHLQVTDKSVERITVEDVSDTADTYEFAYTVKGTREGFEEPNIYRGSDAEDS
jgi:hypothetical protein